MLSIEEWTKEHIKHITKTQIKRVYDILDIPCVKLYNTTKNELLLEIQYDNINYGNIYNILKDEQFGISVTGASEQLGITKYRVNKLINNGAFNVIYERINNNYGKAVKCKFIRYEDIYNYYLENIKGVDSK